MVPPDISMMHCQKVGTERGRNEFQEKDDIDEERKDDIFHPNYIIYDNRVDLIYYYTGHGVILIWSNY